MDIKFILMLVFGCFIDSLFLTILYHKRNNINKYKLLLVGFIVIMAVFNIAFNFVYRPLLTLGVLMLITFLWTKDKYIIAYLACFSLINFFLIEIPMFYILGASDKGFVAVNILKILLINTLSSEYKHKLEFSFLSITLKMFFVIFCFLYVISCYITFLYRG